MNDPISALLATQRSTTLAQSALPHAPVVREVRARRLWIPRRFRG